MENILLQPTRKNQNEKRKIVQFFVEFLLFFLKQ